MTKLIIKHSMGQVLLILILASIVSASHIEWTDFLKNPNAATYEMLVQSLKECDKPNKCIGSSDRAPIYSLLVLVKSGNPYAVDVAVLSLSLGLFDGGLLEDAIRTLGQLAETHPRLLLSCLQKYNITGLAFEDTFVMLPLETVDDIDAKIRTVQKRINSLSSVSDASLKNERDNAILLLKQRLAQLQEMLKLK
jgi:hypothetical protein